MRPLTWLLLGIITGVLLARFPSGRGDAQCEAQLVEYQRVAHGALRPVQSIREGFMQDGVCVVGELG